jgi:hypothetical protein
MAPASEKLVGVVLKVTVTVVNALVVPPLEDGRQAAMDENEYRLGLESYTPAAGGFWLLSVVLYVQVLDPPEALSVTEVRWMALLPFIHAVAPTTMALPAVVEIEIARDALERPEAVLSWTRVVMTAASLR